MGDSLPAHNNRFMAQGLVPGIRLRMEVSVGGGVESHATSVEDVTAEGITILTPMKHLRARPFPSGTVVHAAYVHDRMRWRFLTQFNGVSPAGDLSYLRAPATIESSEQRGHFRLQTAVKPIAIYRLVIDAQRAAGDASHEIEGTIVDLSEGGICFTTRQAAHAGERIGLQTNLPESGQIHARLRVTGVEEPVSGNRNRRVHCQFTEISQADRDRIARYLMRRQLEMRRRGLL